MKSEKDVFQKRNKTLVKNLSSLRRARMSEVESEQLLRTLTEKSIAGIYVVQNGRFRFVNANAASYAGYRVEEMIGMKADAIVHPEDRKLVESNARAMLKGDITAPYEFRIMTKKGKIRWVLETITSILYEGEPAILGNSMDITERKIAEEQLRESERRLADIIGFLPDATLAINRDGKVIAWNRAIEDLTGIKAQDIMGKGNYEYAMPFYGKRRPILIDLVFKPDQKIEKKYYFVRREEGVLLAEADVRIKGEDRLLWGKAGPICNNRGEIVGAIESIRDITERKRIEEARRETERRLADIIDFLPDATFVIDRTGKVIAWNRAIEEMTGVKKENMLGRGNYEYAMPFYGKRRPILIDLVFKPDQKIEKKYYFVRREEGVLLAEADVRIKGEDRLLWGKAGPICNNRGEIVGAIESIRDITERKLAEDALKKREQELETKTSQLEDLNAALRVLLKQREEDKNDLEEKVLANVKNLVMPYLEKLKTESLDNRARAWLSTLDSNLKDIVSPFARKLSSKYVNLTNREIQIAGLIKEGRTTKEISEILGISNSVINIHRYNIRRKFGLSKDHNLQTYLSTLS